MRFSHPLGASLLTLSLLLANPAAATPAQEDSLANLLDAVRDPAAFLSAAWGRGGLDVAAPQQPDQTLTEAALALGRATGTPVDAAAFAAFEASHPRQAAALAPLLTAAAAAVGLVESALAELTPEQASLLAANTHLLPSVLDEARRSPAANDGFVAPVVPAGLREAALAVDAARLATAAALLVDAAVDALDDLTLMQPAGVALNQCPLLIVYDTAPDAHGAADDACLVVVDLGGDDDWNGRTAGVAGIPGSPTSLVRLVVDVQGDDDYASSVAGATGTHTAQGAATLGVGVLVDGLGDDDYSASTEGTLGTSGEFCEGTAGSAVTLAAQGGGVLGAGVLVDLAGDDERDATATAHGNTATVVAQGAGDLGAGALLDDALALGAQVGLGGSDDTRAFAESVIHHPNPNRGCIGAGVVVAQGAGLLGAGARGDGSGDDRDEAVGLGGAGLVVAQGAASGGGGVLVDGLGSDDRTATADGTLVLVAGGPGCWSFVIVGVDSGGATTIAQGGAVLGAGLLLDGEGNDDYLATANAYAEGRALAINTCPFTPSATATVDNDGARVVGQGGANLGAGALVDLLGDDDYEAHASAASIAEARAERPGGFGAATATVSGGGAFAFVHAAVDGIGVSGLADGRGADSYPVSASSTITEIENGVITATTGPTFAGTAAVNGACYTSSPPGLLSGSAGVGIGFDGDPGTLTGCVLPPW